MVRWWYDDEMGDGRWKVMVNEPISLFQNLQHSQLITPNSNKYNTPIFTHKNKRSFYPIYLSLSLYFFHFFKTSIKFAKASKKANKLGMGIEIAIKMVYTGIIIAIQYHHHKL